MTNDLRHIVNWKHDEVSAGDVLIGRPYRSWNEGAFQLQIEDDAGNVLRRYEPAKDAILTVVVGGRSWLTGSVLIDGTWVEVDRWPIDEIRYADGT